MPAKKKITKEMILTKAVKLLRKDGIQAVNVKNLAKHLHCSTQPIYLSFSGMDALRSELIRESISFFSAEMKKLSLDGHVHLYGSAYIHFAKNEPQLFQFLFMRRNAFQEIKEVLTPIIETSISELMEQYQIDHNEADYLHDQLWMHSHGIATMIANGFCDWNMEKAEMMINKCRDSFCQKYKP